MGTGEVAFDNPIYGDDRQKAGLKKSDVVCSAKNLIILTFGVLVTIIAVCLITFFAAKGSDTCEPGDVATTPTIGTTPNPTERPEVCTAVPEWERSICVTEDECPEDYIIRLPRHLLATHYLIEIKPDIYKADTADFDFWGKVTIDMKAEAPTSFIQLNYNNYEIDDATLSVTQDGQSVGVTSITRNKTLDQDLYLVQMDMQLQVGETIQVSMEYGGLLNRIPSSGRGLYWCDYYVANTWKYMVATQGEAAFARELFPCMDDPALKATYAMSVWRKNPMVSLYNMPQIGNPVDMGGGWFVDNYDTTPPMSTYLVAFIVGHYSSKDSPSGHGHTVKIWGPVEYIDSGYADFPASITGSAMDFYDDQFGFTYPLPKLDIALVPDKGGAMENWGLILSGNYAAMLDPAINGDNQRRRHSSTMYHELVHLWFGDLVTCEFWSDIWVNEAYATFYSPFPWTVHNPDWDMQIYDEESGYSNMAYEETGTRHAAHTPILNTKADAQAMFTSISYGRTALVLKMMRNLILTNEQWDTAMKHYMNDNAYGSGTYREIFAAIDKVTVSGEVAPSVAMDTFIRQMGHPVVTITTKRGSNFVDATQKHFLQETYYGTRDQSSPSPFGYKWEVPIRYVTSHAPMTTMLKWLHMTDDTFELQSNLSDTDWILANYEHDGFFRVNYDHDNWYALIKQLMDDHTVIPHRSRGALVIDAFQLARAGEVDFSVPLHLSTYLTKETEYLPFAALIYFVNNYLDTHVRYLESYGPYRQYMRQLYRPLHESLGWTPTGTETEKYISMRLRRYAMDESCKYGNTDCIEEAVRIVTDYKNNPTNHLIVDPDMQVTIFCTAIKYETGSELFEFVWDMFISWLHDDMKEERRAFLVDGLYCSRNAENLTTMFNTVMGEETEISDGDRSEIANGIARNLVGHFIVHDYILSHWSDDHPFRESLLQSLFRYSDTPFLLEQHQSMMKMLNIDIDNPSLYESVSNTVERNIRFRANDAPAIETFFYNVTEEMRPTEIIGETLLPRHLLPVNYDVYLAPDFYHSDPINFTSWGAVQVTFTGSQASDAVFLHYRYINIDRRSVMVHSLTKNLAIHVERVQVINTAYDTVLGVYLSREVAVGENITVGMDFTDIIRTNDTRAGLHWNLYHDVNLDPKYMLGTQLQRTAADWIFPCMDEVGLQATFTIHMAHKPGYMAQSNMPPTSTEPLTQWMLDMFSKYNMYANGWEVTHFQESPVMQTYLVSLAVSDFTFKEAPAPYNTYNVKIWAQQKYIDAGFADYAATVSGMQMDYFSERLDYPFPLPKQDSIVVPDRTGAMENWGLVTYANYYMLIDPDLSDIYDYWQVARVIGHEQAHLWFGDLVSMKFWNDVFLHESYASYWENDAAQHVEPTWDVDQMYFRSRFLSALNSDSLGTSNPIHRQDQQEDSTWGNVLYYKGSAILKMFDRLLMKEHWNETNQLYLSRHAFRNADYYDYLDVYYAIEQKYGLEAQKGVAPSLVIRTWMEQSGYPTVTFSAIPGTDRLKVTQKRFLLRPNRPTIEWQPQEFGYKWEIPLEFNLYMGSAITARDEWLHQTDAEFTMGSNFDPTSDWVLGNLNANGFYRVNYDVSNWQALTTQLDSDHTVIDVKNRAMLVDDSLSLARAGDLDQTVSLQLTEYLAKEVDYAPWYSMYYTGDFLWRRMLPSFTSYDNFLGHMRNILTLPYNTHTWTVGSSEPSEKRMARMLTMQMACQYDIQACRTQARTMFDTWKNSPATTELVHPDLRDAVYCTAIQESTNWESDWDFLFGQYLRYIAEDHFSRIRAQIRDALACFTDRAYQERYWNLAANDDPMIDNRDRYSILDKLARNTDGGQTMVWEKLNNDWDNTPWRNDLFNTLVAYYNTEQDYDNLQLFYQDHSGISESTQTEMNQNTRANIMWRVANEVGIENWLSTVTQA